MLGSEGLKGAAPRLESDGAASTGGRWRFRRRGRKSYAAIVLPGAQSVMNSETRSTGTGALNR
jgi:hypothetical protein